MASPTVPDHHVIYKIVEQAEWQQAVVRGVYRGSPDDLRDGFVHFSTQDQLEGTARKHFSGRPGLMLVAIDALSLGASLKWEPSRGGELFPHLYAPLDPAHALWSRPLALDAAGVPCVGDALEAGRSAAAEVAP